MANEQEELRLVVTFDGEQATAGLRQLQSQMKDLGTGAQAAGTERLKRSAKESQESFMGLGKELTSIAGRLGFIGGFFGGIGAEFSKMGLQALSAATDFKGFADSTVALNNAAHATGTNAAQLKANMAVFKEAGFSGEEAEKKLLGVATARADLMYRGSAVRKRLMAESQGDPKQMEQWIEQVKSAKTNEEALELVRKRSLAIYDEQIKLGKGAQAAAETQRKFEREFGAEGIHRVRRPFEEIPESEKKLYEARTPDAEKTQTNLAATAEAWERILTAIGSVGTHMSVISGAAASMKTSMEAIAKAAEAWNLAVLNADAAADKAAKRPKHWWQRLDPTNQANIDREKAVLAEADKAGLITKDQQEARKRAEEAVKNLPTAPWYKGGTLNPWAQENIDREKAAQDAAVKPEHQFESYRRWRRERQEEPQIAPPAQPEPPPPAQRESPASAPPPAPAPPRDLRPHSVRERERLERERQQSAPQTPTVPLPPVNVPPERERQQSAPPPPPPPAPPAPSQRERSLFEFQPPPQRPDVGQGKAINLDPNRFNFFPQSKAPIEDIRHPGGGQFHSYFDPPTYTKQQMDAAHAESWKTPVGKAYLKHGEELLTNPQIGTTPLDKLGGTLDKYIQRHDALRDKLDNLKSWQRGESMPPAARFAGPLEVQRGGLAPGLGADGGRIGPQPPKPPVVVEQPKPPIVIEPPKPPPSVEPPKPRREEPEQFSQRRETWNAQTMPAMSAQLDQAAAQNINVSGSASISVDVNAPAGTKIGTEIKGQLFKRTEITRQTQMLPADWGPSPASGVTAGMGALSNGTGA